AAQSDDLVETAVDLAHAQTAGLLMQTIDVLRNDGRGDVFFQPSDGMVRGVGPGNGDGLEDGIQELGEAARTEQPLARQAGPVGVLVRRESLPQSTGIAEGRDAALC